jgi:hypothetical protein
MLVVATHGRLMEAVVVAIAAETEAGAVDVREAAGAADVAEAVVDAADAVAVAAGAAVMVAAVVDATNVLLLLPRIHADFHGSTTGRPRF